jgi:predicted nucleotidyltransferase
LAGEDVAARVKKKLSFLQDPFWEKRILGVLLYGSKVRGEAGPRSDIDLCVVAPQAADRAARTCGKSGKDRKVLVEHSSFMWASPKRVQAEARGLPSG